MKNTNLSAEEYKILKDLSFGKSYHQIADHMDIPVRFLTAFLKFIYRKLGVANKTEARLKFMQLLRTDE